MKKDKKKKEDKPSKPWYGIPSLLKDLEKRKADLSKVNKK